MVFFITGAMRTYFPNEDTGWSKWAMRSPDVSFPATLEVKIDKKKSGDWERGGQPPLWKPLSRDEVEKLLKLPESQ